MRETLEYMESFNRSLKQFEEGKIVTKTLDELLAMEDDPIYFNERCDIKR